MNTIKKLAKVYKKVLRNKRINIDNKLEKLFVSNKPQPRNDLERSFFQFECKKISLNHLFYFTNSLIFGFIVVPLITTLLLNGLFKRKKTRKKVIFFSNGLPLDYLPEKYFNSKELIECQYLDNAFLIWSDLYYIKELLRYKPLEFYFIAELIFKIGSYRNILYQYSPDYIIASTEYSFTSSYLTKYCEDLGIKHVNIMHGVKYYNITASFCRFHEAYVWEENYLKLFNDLRWDVSAIIVEKPVRLKKLQDTVSKMNNLLENDYTYYLTYEKAEQLKDVATIIEKLKLSDKKIKVRPHPRYSNLKEVQAYIPLDVIEDYRLISIPESIAASKCAISKHSTVLYEYYLCNKKVLIDDITDKRKYNKLSKQRYTILDKYALLSDEINSLKIKSVIKEPIYENRC